MGVVNMISVYIFILPILPLLYLRQISPQTLTCMSWGSSPYFLTLPNTKLSHSLHLMGVMVSCHKKVCYEIQSIATQRNILLISGDGQRSRWHIILSHTSQWNTKDEYSYFNAYKDDCQSLNTHGHTVGSSVCENHQLSHLFQLTYF